MIMEPAQIFLLIKPTRYVNPACDISLWNKLVAPQQFFCSSIILCFLFSSIRFHIVLDMQLLIGGFVIDSYLIVLWVFTFYFMHWSFSLFLSICCYISMSIVLVVFFYDIFVLIVPFHLHLTRWECPRFSSILSYVCTHDCLFCVMSLYSFFYFYWFW